MSDFGQNPELEQDVAAEAADAQAVSSSVEDGAAADAAAGDGEVAAEGEAEVQPIDEVGVPGLDWYIIHTYSGFEKKVRESLSTRCDAFGFGERIGEILIPTEKVVEMRNGKKVETERLLYPGYVLVQLDLDDELWHVVKNTPRVTGFVGGGVEAEPADRGRGQSDPLPPDGFGGAAAAEDALRAQ
ncbi:MAG: transcription termination/antitermination NusG family protein [Bryobacterales bacterium]